MNLLLGRLIQVMVLKCTRFLWPVLIYTARREFFESECVICFGINIDRQQVVSVIFHVGTC